MGIKTLDDEQIRTINFKKCANNFQRQKSGQELFRRKTDPKNVCSGNFKKNKTKLLYITF